MKYYIEIEKDNKVLQKFSRVCSGAVELFYVLDEIFLMARDKADVVKVYTYDEIHNCETIKLCDEYDLTEPTE